jgi:hypothetical protein
VSVCVSVCLCVCVCVMRTCVFAGVFARVPSCIDCVFCIGFSTLNTPGVLVCCF